MQFEDAAVRDQILLRGFLMGATGSGKSRGALELASKLAERFGDIPITLINTERQRGKLYADRYRFSYIGLENEESLGPETFVRALDLAEQKHPGGIAIIDSVSHEWMGRDGILQRADRFGDWKRVRPQHNDFVERLTAYNGHLIVACRAKMKYEVTEEEVPGRSKPRQIVTPLGVGPIQSDDLQYEFNLVGRFDVTTHEVVFSGHVDPLVDGVYNLLEQGDEVGDLLAKWLSEGAVPERPPAADPGRVAELRAALDADGFTSEQIEHGFAVARRQNGGELHPEWVEEKLADAIARLKKKGVPTGEEEPAGEDEPSESAEDADAVAPEADEQPELAAAGGAKPKK